MIINIFIDNPKPKASPPSPLLKVCLWHEKQCAKCAPYYYTLMGREYVTHEGMRWLISNALCLLLGHGC